MSGGRFNYAYLKAGDFNDAGQLLAILPEMRDYCESIHPRAVIHLDLYIQSLQEMEAAFLKKGEGLRDLLKAIEWEASSDWGIDDVTEALDCIGLPGHAHE